MDSEPDIVPELPQDEAPAPQTQAEAVPATDNSAEEDAVLDRLLGIDEPAPRRVDPAPEPSAPANDPDLDRALKALQRDGVPADVIEGIRSDPSKVKEWGLKAAKRQADVDAFGAKVAESKKADAKASVESGDKESDADPLSEFNQIFGEEATKPLKAITEKMRAELEERTRALEVKYETRSAYDRISQQYGKDAPSIDEIMDVAARVGRENPGKFDSIAEIVTEAFRLKAGEPRRPDPRSSARPTVGKAPPRPVRTVDREDVALDILLNGGNRNDVQRALSR